MRLTRKHYTQAQKDVVIQMWTTGAGRIPEIANAMDMPKSTVYGILERAGLWNGVDDPSSKTAPYKSELAELLSQNPAAKRRADLNASMRRSNSPDKLNADLIKFMVDAVRAGFCFADIAEVCNVDPKTVAKYSRKFIDVPPMRVSKAKDVPVKLAQAQQMSLPIQFAEPQKGVLRRFWSWLFG